MARTEALRMLAIRTEQMAALGRAAFQTRMAEHLGKFFPRHCAALGPSGVARAIDDGAARATAHGFEAEREIGQYIDLTFIFGSDFDRNPSLPWAAPILADRSPPAGERMDRLYGAAVDHLRMLSFGGRRA